MRAWLSVLLLAACGGGSDDKGECPTMDIDDAGDLSAQAAERCNVSGSMGQKNWYRLVAEMPGAPGNVVQLELWPERGAFSGGTVHPGTFQITGADADFATCGLCLRAKADKGGDSEREYFATSGSVVVTAVAPDEGAPFEATITDATFVEVDADHVSVADGCVADVARVKVTGSVVQKGGGGGGGGGGGSSGSGGCVTTVGD